MLFCLMLLDWTWPSSSPFHHAQHMRCLCDHEAARHWQCKACFVSGSKYCSGLSAQSKQTGERESKRVSLSAAPHFRWTLDGGREVRKQRRKTVEEQTEKVIKTSSRPFPQIREGMNKIPWSPACLARARSRHTGDSIQLRDWESERGRELLRQKGSS